MNFDSIYKEREISGSIPQTVLVWKIRTYKKLVLQLLFFWVSFSDVKHISHSVFENVEFSFFFILEQICTSSCIQIVNNPKILLTAKFPSDGLLEKTTSSLLFGELTLLLQHCSATPCHLSFLWTWFWSSNTDFLLTWITWPLSCFSIIHPWSARMIWTGLWWIWDDNNAGIATVQREAARTLTLKY